MAPRFVAPVRYGGVRVVPRPHVAEAVCWLPDEGGADSISEVFQFLWAIRAKDPAAPRVAWKGTGRTLIVSCGDDDMTVTPGDWLVYDTEAHRMSCFTQAAFARAYDDPSEQE